MVEPSPGPYRLAAVIARRVAVISLVAASIAAGGCGGDDSEEEAAAPAPSDQEAQKGTKAKGVTKPGATLKLGQTAGVRIKPLTAAAGSKKTYRLDVAALEIEKGSIDDLKNVNLDAEQKKTTPYYVTVRVTNPGGTVPVENDDPDIRFNGIDDRGQRQPSVTFIGTFERCDNKEAPAPFGKGKSYESCLAYLMPGGGSIEQVQWSGSDEYAVDPVTWK
jgi:hypothetical protein